MIGKYHGTDLMIDVIGDDYRMLQVISRFGITLGFGDQTVAETCKSAGVDLETFLTIVNYLKEVGTKLENQTIYISHADDEASAAELAVLIKQKISCKGVFLDYIGPIVGASVGPGTIIAYCTGKEETRVGEE